jgi:hypothetical protein
MFRGNVRHAVSVPAGSFHPGTRTRSYSGHGLGRVRTVHGRGLAMPLPESAAPDRVRTAVLKVILALLLITLAAARFRLEQPADASWLPAELSGTSAASRG